MGYFKERSLYTDAPGEEGKPAVHKSVQDCQHPRRAYRYGDKTYPQWVCRDCGFEYDGVEHKPMTLKEIEDGIDVLFGPKRSY